eukprot:TRINITY_DN59884_c0_g1_i1.p1 TRINITY_DN59884_c0_g1~~TRINITY_DN59884_c0_g1_i1.p1  ORF type:complete len:449 (-),score=36.67 TRINITY_DN59884_c0_g1_i1:1351-2697(-)
MVKIRVLSRNDHDYKKDKATDLSKVHRNFDEKLHPLQRAVELKRAVNAAKLERLFAKPFLCSFETQMDTVGCLASHPTSLAHILCGDYSGELRVWDIGKRTMIAQVPHAHKHWVTGVAFSPDGEAYLSCSLDKTVKMWQTKAEMDPENMKPLATFLSDKPLKCLSHHYSATKFATAGDDLQVWDINRTTPLQTFNWGNEPLTVCSFNKAERNLLVCGMSDRSVCLYDLRVERATQKMTMHMKCNGFSWNPMAPMNFVAANDDNNCYYFDCRKWENPLTIFHGHVGSAMTVDFAPTGQEFVSGSFDKTLRIWPLSGKMARDTYHLKRMQRVMTTLWSLDNNYILSGSDDCNVRLWKANASKPMKPLKAREKRALAYNEKLKDKFAEFPEVYRIRHQRRLPRAIQSKTRVVRKRMSKQKRKVERVVARLPEGAKLPQTNMKKMVVVGKET